MKAEKQTRGTESVEKQSAMPRPKRDKGGDKKGSEALIEKLGSGGYWGTL
jgi:hypothetical protein